MKRKTIHIIVLFLLMLSVGALQAQVDKGVTRTGKAVDCSTLDPSVDKAVSERGAIVTHPRVTRNGKIIKTGCCPTLEENSLTDTVTCVSVSMAATISDGTASTAVLQVFSDAAYNTQVGSDIPATVTEGKITAQALNLECHTRYYFRLKLNNQCNYDWTDSTRDLTLLKETSCEVLAKFENEHLKETGIIDSVYDHEGNAYSVVQIGEQCWLKSNMRCTTSPRQGQTMNGILMDLSRTTTDTSYFTPFYYDYAEVNGNPNPLTLQERGYLYNWSAAIDTVTNASFNQSFTNRRGICPAGWHLPTYDEWTELERGYLTMPDGTTPIDETELSKINEYRGNGAGKFTSGCYWAGLGSTTSPISYSYAERNITGLSVLPTGYFNGSLLGFGTHAPFWSSTSFSDDEAWFRRFLNTSSGVYNYHFPPKTYGRSVRCLRDVLIPEMSVCEDTTFGTIALKDVKNTVKIEFIQGTTVKKTVNNPDTAVYVSDLTVGTYKVKATSATGDTLIDNARVKHTYTHCTGTPRVGTDLGGGKLANNEWSSVTNQIDSVSDHEGNVYEVVQIGNQCWLKENMRCTTSPRQGTGSGKVNLLAGETDTTDSHNPRYYDYNTTTGDYPQMLTERQRGLFYNWVAAMDTMYTATTQPIKIDFPNRRGICPIGWHLPTDAEWLKLEKGFLMENDGITPVSDETLNKEGEGRLTKGACKFVAGCAWLGIDNTTVPSAYSNSDRNITGFSALPVGSYSGGGFKNAGVIASFWTATSDLLNYAMYRRFNTAEEGIRRLNTHKNFARSVRCVRNNECDFVPATSCSVSSVRQLDGTTDLSHEHLLKGTTDRIDSVYDHQGNAYGVVQIGEQCWLKSNMRATTSPKTGNNILWTSILGTTGYDQYAINRDCSPNISSEYGLYYNWPAALDTTFTTAPDNRNVSFVNRRGICPKGWHIPSDGEWTVMTTTVGIGVGSETGAGKLASGCDWKDYGSASQPGNKSYADRNKFGFSVVPTGYYNGNFIGFGEHVWFCTSTSRDATYYYARTINYNKEFVEKNPFNKQDALYVRCIRDVIIPELSVCEDTTFGQVTLTTLTNADKVEFYQGSTLKKTDNAPAQGKVYADLPQGTYSVIATSSSGHTDTVTAYVKHTYTHCTGTPHAGTDLGNGKFANREWGNAEINQIDSVSDHEGNVYEVVQINNQCWLKQNMRATTEPSGTIILQNPVTDISFTDRRAYAIDNNADNIPVYGLLYNWPAAVDTTASTTKEISFVGNRRGICPQGWHLPSSAEFQAMANYLNVGINSGVDALKIVSSCGWSAAEGDTPGNLSADKNISGLSLLPTGFYHNGDLKFSSIGETASIWTATSGTAKNTNAFAANYNQSFVKNWSTDNASGRSVRCVRNATASLTVSSDKSNAKICSPDAATITYTANLVGATASSYSWSTGEVTNTNTLTVNYTTTGTYTVSCTAASLLSNEVSVNITNGTAAKFGVCEEFVSGTAQVIDEGNCNSFVWKNASGDTVQTGKSIAVSASIPAGIYTVVGAITGGCSATRTVTLGNSTFKPCHVSSRGSNEFGSESDIVETVTDHQNNSYSVVEIGGQCWMRENLRCTENLSHTNLIVNHDVNDIDVAHAYNFNDNPEYGSKYGVLYNWKAAMNGAPSTTANPSNVRGLCPEGWHLPSKEEWQVLLTTVGVGTKNSGRLATGCDWWVDDRNTTTPGDYSYVERNSSGFSARPFGNIVAGTYYGESFNALFWTATELPAGSSFTAFDQVPPYQVSLPSNENAYYFYSYFNRSDVLFDLNQGMPPVTKYTQKDNAYYVRCVRNN